MGEIIKNLRDFLFYLFNIYGVFSGFTAFFPLSHKLFAIMLPPKDYPDATSLFATIACVYLIFFKFSQRENAEQLPVVDKKSIVLPIVLGIFYVYTIQNIPPFSPYDFHPSVIWEFGMAFVVVLFVTSIKPVVYVAIFYTLTDLFSTLAVKEWQKRHGKYY